MVEHLDPELQTLNFPRPAWNVVDDPLSGAVQSGPRVLLRLEGAALLCALLAAYGWSGHSWWLFAAVFLVADLSMLGYLADARIGAAAYNAVHCTIGPMLVGAAGLLLGNPFLPWLGAIWMAHIGFDRMLGYGPKYPSGFKQTHLGPLGAGEPARPRASWFGVCRA